MAGGLSGGLRRAAATLYGAAWETRRRGYAAGWLEPERVPARVVSLGNLTVGGTGKTTLTLHLARRARAHGVRCAVVCRNYRPGPQRLGDEAQLYARSLGEDNGLFAGRSKRDLARQAAARGHALVLVDDGFSHWGLARDLDVVLVDARDPWGGGALLPLGRLREPRRALQRAGLIVVSRLAPGDDPDALLAAVRPYAPAARLAAGRHRVTGVRPLGAAAAPEERRVRVVTATGNPQAVAASAAEAGLEVVGVSAYRDHHWFTPGEIRNELAQARRDRAIVLVTAKDAVRWAPRAGEEPVAVLEVEWAWVAGGEAAERLVFTGEAHG